MNNQTTNAAPKSFIVTATYWQNAEEMQKDLNQWLAAKNNAAQTLPTVTETEPTELSKYVEREERDKIATLLFEYGNSSHGYRNLLHLLYDFLNESDNDDMQSGLWVEVSVIVTSGSRNKVTSYSAVTRPGNSVVN